MGKPETKVITACVAIAAPSANSKSLQALLEKLRPDLGAAFIVVARPDVNASASVFVEQMSQAGRLSARLVTDGMRIEPNVLYVVDDNTVVSAVDTYLQVRPTTPGDGRVDSLLPSVAERFEERAIVVLLGQLGVDGTAGVASTKRCGGFAIAEESIDNRDPDPLAVTAAVLAD